MFKQRINKRSGWLGFGDRLRLAGAGLAPGSSCSNQKHGFAGQRPMGAGERRGLTRASGKTAGPERALLLGYRRRCGPWLLLPSCPRWSPGCSGPHRIAASIVVSSTSRQFGKRAGSWVSAASRAEPSVGGRLGSRGTLKDSLSISARGGCGHREEGGGRRGSRAQPQSATWVLARRGGLLPGARLSEGAGLPQAWGVDLSRGQSTGGTGSRCGAKAGGFWGAPVFGNMRKLPGGTCPLPL